LAPDVIDFGAMSSAREREMSCVRIGVALCAMLASWSPVRGQDAAARQAPPASQHGTVSQTIAGTVVTVHYDRPSARGRVLFGEEAVVVSDALWTPGANRATILELSGPARIEGRDVAAGRYGVWTIPRPDRWTLILSRVWDTHHSIYPGAPEDVLRTEVSPQPAAHMETLAFYFPVVGPYDATLVMHWGTTALPIRIEIRRP
jgi:hypothetical protein